MKTLLVQTVFLLVKQLNMKKTTTHGIENPAWAGQRI